jgi:hypothetical protein
MATTNIPIYNAALAAFIGATQQRAITSPTPSSYAPVVAAAIQFATEVDSQIPLDEGIPVKKVNTCQAICFGVMAGRYSLDTNPTDYLVTAKAIAALYANAVAALQ